MIPALALALLLTPPSPDCRNPGTWSVPDACSVEPLAVAEAEMNRTLAEAVRQLRAIDRTNRNRAAEQKLAAAQRAWTTYRDSQCALAGLQAIDAGLLETLENRCRTEMTQRRTGELRILAFTGR
jgi:uncharacterized protein YecT (DUF1311 family)